jgi:hypothetical protein
VSSCSLVWLCCAWNMVRNTSQTRIMAKGSDPAQAATPSSAAADRPYSACYVKPLCHALTCLVGDHVVCLWSQPCWDQHPFVAQPNASVGVVISSGAIW